MSKNFDDDSYVPSRYRAKEALEDLDALEELFILPSDIAKREESKKESKKKETVSEPDDLLDTDWMDTLSTLRTEKKRFKNVEDLFGEGGKKKKKKKKKNADGPKDHSEDFENELRLLRNILKEQTGLSDSLQERYDTLNRQKSSARGVGKFTTDLIATLNHARTLEKDIVKEITGIKKTIADLNMKEREKFGKLENMSDEDMNQFASTYLKKIMGANQDINGGFGESIIDDVIDADDFYGELDLNMRESDGYASRSEDADKYLKYEKQQITVKILYDQSDESMQFFAENENGEIVDDYPLPGTIDSVRINHSTKIGTDRFGQKFQVIYQ